MKYLFLLLILQTPLCYGQIVQGNNTFYGIHMDDNIEQVERVLSQKGIEYESYIDSSSLPKKSWAIRGRESDRWKFDPSRIGIDPPVIRAFFYGGQLRLLKIEVPSGPDFKLATPEFTGQAKQIFKDLIRIYGNDYIKRSSTAACTWGAEPQIEIKLYYGIAGYYVLRISNKALDREFYRDNLQLPRIATVTEDNVNFRASPKLSGKSLGQLNKGNKIQILELSETKEYTERRNEQYWFQFQYDENNLAWVRDDWYLDLGFEDFGPPCCEY